MLLLNLFFKTALAQERQLETAYPEIFGIAPETVEFGIAQYATYIFNFIIILVGLIAFAVLIWAGIRYLTSSGKPEETKKARQQIKSAIGGIVILLLSYLILTTINPKLILFDLPLLKPAPPIDVTQPTIPPPISADPFVRVESLAEAAKSTARLINDAASTIKSLTDGCSCSTTQPLCIVKNYMGGACRAEYCYAASLEQPCPSIRNINENRQRLVDLRDLILYYKNRARAEAQDLRDEVERIVDEKIKFLSNRISAEKETLQKCQTDNCRGLEQRIIASTEKDVQKLQDEKSLKLSLSAKLVELASAIEKFRTPATEISALPDQCLINVRTQCKGSCSGGGHDKKGCFSGRCSGGNPCPTGSIQSRRSEINSISQEVSKKADEIVELLR